MTTATAPVDTPPSRARRWLELAVWLVGVLLFGAIGLSAVDGLVETIRLTVEADNVRATVAAGVAVVLFVLAAVLWLTGIGFVARWRGARWTLTIGIGTAIVIRLLLAVAVQTPITGGGSASVNGDALALYAQAVRTAESGLVAGDWAFGYPAILGALFALAGEQRWLEAALDVVASLAIGVILFDLLKRAGGVEVAAAGIGLFAIMPSQALLVPVFGPDLAYAALVLGAIWLLVAGPSGAPRLGQLVTRPGRWSTVCAAGAGALVGLSHMLRPTSLALLPAFAILALVLLRSSYPRRAAAALVVAFLAVLVPVVVDNAGRHGAISLEPTSYAGWRLAVGTNPALLGGVSAIDADELDDFPGPSTRVRSDAAGAEAFARVIGGPAAFAELMGPKFMRSWGDDTYGARLALGAASAGPAGGLLLAFEIASQLMWTFAALAAAWGVARSWPLSGVLVAAVLVAASLAALHAVIATEGRDHAVVVPLMLVAAAAGLSGPLTRGVVPPVGVSAPG